MTDITVAVAATLELGDDRFGTSVDGTRRQVERALGATPAGSVVAGTAFRPTRMYFTEGGAVVLEATLVERRRITEN